MSSIIDDYQSIPGPRSMFPMGIQEDPWYVLCKRADEDANFLNVVDDFLRGRLSRLAGMEFLNADDKFYRDSRASAYIIADETAVSLAATDKLITAGARTALPGNYFYPTKRVKVEYFMRFTTVLTPGNVGIEIYYGSTDAGGTLLASSGAVALVASKTAITCRAEAYGHCRLLGATGSLFAMGQFTSDPVGALISGNMMMIPANTPVAVTVDTTAAQGFNMQVKRSGSTAEAIQVHDMLFEALN